MRTLWICACSTLACIALVACEPEQRAAALRDGEIAGGPVCAFDDSEGPESAVVLASSEAVTGALCPVRDQDWFAVTVPPEHGLITVELSVDAPISPVEPTYALRRPGEDTVVATPGPVAVGQSLAVTHCVAPGAYDLVVRDQGDDGQDRRNEYTLRYDTRRDPDPTEPDGSAETARPLRAGSAVEGRLACRSDEDWYAVEVTADQVLEVVLEMPATTLEPRLRIVDVDGAVITDLVNYAGRREPTLLRRALALRTSGTVHVVISDDNGFDADPQTAYSLQVTLGRDIDQNEPNDRAEEATALAQSGCGADWSDWLEMEGSVGAPGDPDWFRVPLAGCASGLIEAEVVLDESDLSAAQTQTLQQTLQASVALVVTHGPTACDDDLDCRELSQPCQSGWDCAGFGNTCLPSGQCAGATSCLAEGRCGAFRVERRHTPGSAGPNRAHLVAPVEGTVAYLRVGDVGGDGFDPGRAYQLRVRTMAEPDENEPSNLYTPVLLRSDPMDVQVAFAQAHHRVPVHDCTAEVDEDKGDPVDAMVADAAVDAGVDAARDLGVPDADVLDAQTLDAQIQDAAVDAQIQDAAVVDAQIQDAAVVDAQIQDAAVVDAQIQDAAVVDAQIQDAEVDLGPPVVPDLVPGCCGPDDWIEGAISYPADQDWYVYAHPCPGEDCAVRIRFEVDGGPVDPLWQIYRGDQLWFDTVIPDIEERVAQPAVDGQFGGVEPDDRCFYAFEGHRGRRDTPFYYALRIRDLLPEVDWSPGQRYRFCIEKAAATCVAPPCAISPNGECTTP
jgi:hypothetical protein